MKTYTTGNEDAPCEKLFTLEEVKEIVARVVAEREAALRQEYTQTLEKHLRGKKLPLLLLYQQLLVQTLIRFFFFYTDQFTMFSQFNEDHISRQLKQR